jgi:cupin 2 domain-containing protein
MPSLLDDLATPDGMERFDELLVRPGVVIERIVSTGQITPVDTPYQQAWDEWVLLVAGGARLWIEGQDEIALAPGDYVLIPAQVRHRVLWTQADPPTVWLALHFRDREGSSR